MLRVLWYFFSCLQASTAFQAGSTWIKIGHLTRQTFPQTLFTRWEMFHLCLQKLLAHFSLSSEAYSFPVWKCFLLCEPPPQSWVPVLAFPFSPLYDSSYKGLPSPLLVQHFIIPSKNDSSFILKTVLSISSPVPCRQLLLNSLLVRSLLLIFISNIFIQQLILHLLSCQWDPLD